MAAASYERALAKEPKNLQALWGLALTEYDGRQYASARERLATIVAVDPNFKFGEAFLAYGRTLVALGDKDAAREHLAGGIKRWSYPEAHVLLAGLLIERGEVADARKLLESVVFDMRAGPEFNQRRNRRWVRQAQGMLSRLAGHKTTYCHQCQLASKNSVMLMVIVTHQLIGQYTEMPSGSVSRNSVAAIRTTLASTLAAETHRGAAGHARLTSAAGSSANEPTRQIQPRCAQYRWR